MLITAERVVLDGIPRADIGILVGPEGRIRAVDLLENLGEPDHNLVGRVLLPGFVNAHSHAFQRLLRGRTHVASANPSDDNFWSWRDVMYQVANRLDPDSIYTVAKHAFIEMLLAGVTSVGEFHYIHHQPDGTPYDTPG